MARLRFVALVLGFVLIAGCTGGSSKLATGSTAVPPAPSASVSADTGSITGTVTSDEDAPIVGADVVIDGTQNGTAKSDALGAFTFNGLGPGDYTVTTQKLGYESIAKRATVVSGQATTVGFVLRSIAIDSEPRTVSKQYDNFIDGPDLYTAAVTVYHPQSFSVELTKGARDVVVSMAWLANAPTTARYMYQGVSFGDAKNHSFGKSPLTMNISDLEVEKAKDKATVSWYLYFACLVGLSPQGVLDYEGCVAQNPEALVPVVAYQQKVTHYSTVFYNGPAPDGYTGLPG